MKLFFIIEKDQKKDTKGAFTANWNVFNETFIARIQKYIACVCSA